jgi:hypothetical protein
LDPKAFGKRINSRWEILIDFRFFFSHGSKLFLNQQNKKAIAQIFLMLTNL